MSLADLQRDFRAFLETGEAAIEPRVGASARRGLAVYHHAYRANLIACLRDSFEKTCAWLGEDAFAAAALAHIAEHPPTSWTLADYGPGFDQTLARLYPADPEVEELAWLDWALRRAFDGPDSPAADPAAWAEVDWELARLQPAPTLALRPVTTNAAAIWSALAEGRTPPAVQGLEGFAGLRVWRQDLSPRFASLEAAEYLALERAARGVRFGEICAALTADCADPDHAAAFAGAMLARWLREGVVIGFASEMPNAAA